MNYQWDQLLLEIGYIWCYLDNTQVSYPCSSYPIQSMENSTLTRLPLFLENYSDGWLIGIFSEMG